MTENEAVTKRCCGPEGCGAANASDGLRYCIGSECMAWMTGDSIPRYEYSEGPQMPDGVGWVLHESNVATHYFLWRRPIRSTTADGRCGLVVQQ